MVMLLMDQVLHPIGDFAPRLPSLVGFVHPPHPFPCPGDDGAWVCHGGRPKLTGKKNKARPVRFNHPHAVAHVKRNFVLFAVTPGVE